MKPLSIYIHIPFCKSRCHYCDFLTFDDKPCQIEDYVKALEEDIAASGADFMGYSVETVFFGGGTPSLLTTGQLGGILRALNDNFSLYKNCHMSVEANPDTVDKTYLAELYGLGFRRISFGVQSFDDEILKHIGRVHNADAARKAVEMAQKAGFDDISVDLIFALPHQTLDNFKASLDAALSLPITHISCYALSVEGGTPLAENKPLVDAIPDDALDRQMYALAKEKLAEAGFEHYEISNWAKEGYMCRHNLGYWTGREYLGLGLGASSYFGGKRLKKTECLESYIKGDFSFSHTETIDKQTQMAEFALLGLRLTEGICVADFKNRFNQDIFEVYGEVLTGFLNQGLLVQKNNKISLTPKGLDLSNTVFCEFL
ncbi:MAG: radical SAM family heme chaperone HemW [Defluviitaleaceae bacterium]|nr:radical SAM family heme chaperone HemW [Defluviitaleaceae bacterium]